MENRRLFRLASKRSTHVSGRLGATPAVMAKMPSAAEPKLALLFLPVLIICIAGTLWGGLGLLLLESGHTAISVPSSVRA